jgi:hypothetical protein
VIVNIEQVEQIAEAVLYEGYMLYPYRPSSVKNQQRWNFGVLCPQSYCEMQTGSELSFVQTECLLRTTSSTRLTVKIRFLQIVERLVGRFKHLVADGADEGEELEFVDRLEVDGHAYQPWQEAVERSFTFDSLDVLTLFPSNPMEFYFPDGSSVENVRDTQGRLIGAIMRQWETLAGSFQLGVEACRDDVAKLTVRIENGSDFDATDSRRHEALLHSLVSVHAILGVEKGEFLSLLDPLPGYEDLAAQCKNEGVWPVLAGGDATTMLASPIILYDNPQIAPESAGNLFDSTEIDEILSLRILTLTDEEKREIRQSDERAKELLERTETIPVEQFMKLHGVLRGLTTRKETQG